MILKLLILGFVLLHQVNTRGQNDQWKQTIQLVNYYFLQGAYPGGILSIANNTHTLFNYPFGYYSKNNIPYGSPPITAETVYDIASLTKIVATLTCIMHLYDMRVIQISDLVSDYIPEYNNNGKQNTTLQNLLLHNAGLLQDHPQPMPPSKSQILSFIYNCAPSYPIGSKYSYSDLGFIILAQIAQRIIGGPLQDYSKILLDKIGLQSTQFLPNNKPYIISPTQYIPKRGKVSRGQVDDQTAYIFGGIAGDAGLFSNVYDLVKFMQFHLNKGLFYTRKSGLVYQNRRALGWDTVPLQQNPPCGNLFSLNSFGHTGYTGTMMWADRDKNLIIVLLTNRVHPSDINILIREARTKISDSVVKQYLKQLSN